MNTYQKYLSYSLFFTYPYFGCLQLVRRWEQSEEMLEIGIIQIAPHPSLDNCYQGLLKAWLEGFTEGKISKWTIKMLREKWPTAI